MNKLNKHYIFTFSQSIYYLCMISMSQYCRKDQNCVPDNNWACVPDLARQNLKVKENIHRFSLFLSI